MNAMRFLSVALITTMTGLLVSTAESQVTLQLGAGAGVTFPLGEYSGETTDYYAGTKYGLSTGYSVQAKGRVALTMFTLVGSIGYQHFSNSGPGEGDRGKVEVSQSVFSIKAGPEFNVPIPAVPLRAYVGGNIAWNSISGETMLQGLTGVPSGSFDIPAASRFGFGINGGVVIKLGPLTNLDLGAEYAFINPLGKDWQVTERNDIRIDSYKALNDSKDPLYETGDADHFIGESRSISTFQIVATFMFGL